MGIVHLIYILLYCRALKHVTALVIVMPVNDLFSYGKLKEFGQISRSITALRSRFDTMTYVLKLYLGTTL